MRHQKGSLAVHGSMWRARFFVSRNGKRFRKSVALGLADKLTEKEAKERMRELIAVEVDQCLRVEQVLRSSPAASTKLKIPTLPRGSSPYTSGAVSEFLVCADLMARGFDTFRATNGNSSCDVIYLDNGRAVRVEVKSRSWDSLRKVLGQIGKFDVLAVAGRDGRVEYYAAERVTESFILNLLKSGEAVQNA